MGQPRRRPDRLPRVRGCGQPSPVLLGVPVIDKFVSTGEWAIPGAPPERLELRIYPSRADVYLRDYPFNKPMSADDNNSRYRSELVGAIEDYLAAWHAFTHDLVSPREAAEEVLAMAFRGTNQATHVCRSHAAPCERC